MSPATQPAGRLSGARLRAAGDLLLTYPFRVWHYGESVGLEGLLRLGALLEDPRYEAWVHGLLRGWATRRRPFAEIDNTLPGKVLCELADRHCDDVLLEAALDAAGHLSSRRMLRGVALAFEEAPLQSLRRRASRAHGPGADRRPGSRRVRRSAAFRSTLPRAAGSPERFGGADRRGRRAGPGSG